MHHTLRALGVAVWAFSPVLFAQDKDGRGTFGITERGYFARYGVNVMVFEDEYPEGHQGGVTIVQHGERVATNGDLRLEPTPGQWAPVPKLEDRIIDAESNAIRVKLHYPDSAKDKKGFNPIDYPSDLQFRYKVKVEGQGASVRIKVDLERPLPDAWVGRVGYNLELYPSVLFGKGWQLDGVTGVFPRQPNGPVFVDERGETQGLPYAIGKKLTVASDDEVHRMVIESHGAPLELLDGRVKHQNGWFVVRSAVSAGTTSSAVDWTITPNAVTGWKYRPVVHVSQVGYHPAQRKIAIVETDASDTNMRVANLVRVTQTGARERVLSARATLWGPFLRYRYAQFDFSSVREEGLYWVEYGGARTEPFRIAKDVYQRHVWQPTLEYFLPVQMCHMRVSENYRVWHGLCHMDDARMAPLATNHFDGYVQGESSLTQYAPLEAVPGLNVGGWHDAGDDDLRVESQVTEAYILSLAYENFAVTYDATSIDQISHSVEIHRPDGHPDVLQQIEHGLLSVTSAYESMGRLYRGIISPTLRQYVMVGDVANQTDNLAFDSSLKESQRTGAHSGRPDDRLVFTEANAERELSVAAGLATAARVLRGHNSILANKCLQIAEKIWKDESNSDGKARISAIHAAIELYLTSRLDARATRPGVGASAPDAAAPTRGPNASRGWRDTATIAGRAELYRQFIVGNQNTIEEHIDELGWLIGRVLPLVNDSRFALSVRSAVAKHTQKTRSDSQRNPFGVPYETSPWGPGWGAGWALLRFGVEQYFLHKNYPELVGTDGMLNALAFVLGSHPGESRASFASGIGSRSVTAAYGYTRADWGYIPGGVVSGTALIRPDFFELKDFPFLWQQTEYVIGHGAGQFIFLVLAADSVLNTEKAWPGARD